MYTLYICTCTLHAYMRKNIYNLLHACIYIYIYMLYICHIYIRVLSIHICVKMYTAYGMHREYMYICIEYI